MNEKNIIERLEQLENRVRELEKENQQLQEENKELRKQNQEFKERFLEELADDRQRITTLEESNEDRAMEIAETKQRVTEIETRSNKAGLTQIEEVIQYPEKTSINVTKSVERAKDIFLHYPEESVRSPRGDRYVLEGDNIKQILERIEGELDWKQVNRACRKLEDMTSGKIEFVEDTSSGIIQKDSQKSTKALVLPSRHQSLIGIDDSSDTCRQIDESSDTCRQKISG